VIGDVWEMRELRISLVKQAGDHLLILLAGNLGLRIPVDTKSVKISAPDTKIFGARNSWVMHESF
jgi:hypothetical protein